MFLLCVCDGHIMDVVFVLFFLWLGHRLKKLLEKFEM